MDVLFAWDDSGRTIWSAAPPGFAAIWQGVPGDSIRAVPPEKIPQQILLAFPEELFQAGRGESMDAFMKWCGAGRPLSPYMLKYQAKRFTRSMRNFLRRAWRFLLC